MKANIKKSNYWQIIDDWRWRSIEGAKFRALYRLIQWKGEPVQATGHKIHGLKALQISDNEYVCILLEPQKEGQFFPCMFQKFLLTKLQKEEQL